MADWKYRDYSDKEETDAVRALAEEKLALQLPRDAEAGSEGNLVGIKSESLLFSRRLDSRTYFVQDQRHGLHDEGGVFQGDENELIQFGERLLDALGIPLLEIDKSVVLKEQHQGAQIDDQGDVVAVEPIEEGAYYAWFTRKVEELPVWDSRLMLSLTNAKTIGFMELHWPEIPDHVLVEGHRLAYRVAQGWQPPEYPGAMLESIEAGIIHSPALGYFMDIYPTIRATYRGTAGIMGVDAVLHVDRDGNPVPFPRQVELPKVVPPRRRPPEQGEDR